MNFKKPKKPKQPFRDMEDFFMIPDMGVEKPTRIFSTPVESSSEHFIYLDDEIGPAKQYREEFQTLKNAGENDIIYLHLCTPGGHEDTGFMFVDHIRQTAATVVAIIGPDCSSAGADIALSCHGWMLSEFSQMLVHNVAYGVGFQKEQDIVDFVNFKRKQSERIAHVLYEGFLKEDEFSKFIEGKQMWFDADDLRERLPKLGEHRKAQEEKEALQAELDEEQEGTEEVEFDASMPNTWPEGSVVQFLKAIKPFKKNQKAEILRFHETDMGDAIELLSESDWGIISPYDHEYLKYFGQMEKSDDSTEGN